MWCDDLLDLQVDLNGFLKPDGCYYSVSSSSRQSLLMGLSRTLVCVLTLTALTRPLESDFTSNTLPKTHEPHGAEESTTITTSPGVKLPLFVHYFCLSCMRGKYSWLQRFQNKLAMYCTCLQRRLTYRSFFSKIPDGRMGLVFRSKMWFGVRGSKSCGSLLTVVIGRLFKMASTSHRMVCSPSSSRVCCWCRCRTGYVSFAPSCR